MTKSEIAKLDKLYQIEVLKLYNGKSPFGGDADCIHHFVPKAQGFSVRWYIPDGIPVTQLQHNMFHGKERRRYEDAIIKIRGQEWYNDLKRQQVKVAKSLDFDKIRLHILGKAENYI